MGYKSLDAFPPSYGHLVEKVVTTGEPLRMPFPHHAKGSAINRAITIRSFLKLLRSTPSANVPTGLRHLHVASSVMYVSGPTAIPEGWVVTVHPSEPLTGYSLEEQLGDYIPLSSRAPAPAPKYPENTPRVTEEFEVEPAMAFPDLSDARLWAIFKLQLPIRKYLPAHQKERMDAMALGALPLPPPEEVERELADLQSGTGGNNVSP